MNKEIMKRLPFAETNVEGIELWLDQMALEGLFLCDTAGSSWYFREGEPEAIRYRLDKVTEKGAMPSVEKRESYQKKGWKYLLTHKTMYHIFQAKDPQAEELHMDGLEESLKLKQLQTTFRSNLILCIASAAAGYWLYRMTGYVFFQYPLLSIVSPDFNRIFLAVWLAGCVLSCIFSYKDVRAMRRYMAEGRKAGYEKELTGRSLKEKLSRYFFPIWFFLYFGACILFRPESVELDGRMNFEGLPVLEAFEDGTVETSDGWFLNGKEDRYIEYKNLLLNENYALHETRMVTKEGQAESRETSISAYYFDSRISALTEPLFKELVRKYTGAESSDLAQSAPSGTGLDHCVYVKEGEKQVVAAAEGNRILVVEYDGQSDMKEKTGIIKEILEKGK